MGIEPGSLSRFLEHSLLNADLTRDALQTHCRAMRTLQVAAVCVAPYYVADAVDFLSGSGLPVCAAVGFPGALMSTEAKIADVRACVKYGAREIDLAIDIAAVKSGDMAKAERDFAEAARVAGGPIAVKAVFEHGSYTPAEQEAVLRMIGRTGVAFVKIQNMTSGHGARPEEIHLVRSVLGNAVAIKIDGGVKTPEQAIELIAAGATRIGLTATKEVLKT